MSKLDYPGPYSVASFFRGCFSGGTVLVWCTSGMSSLKDCVVADHWAIVPLSTTLESTEPYSAGPHHTESEPTSMAEWPGSGWTERDHAMPRHAIRYRAVECRNATLFLSCPSSGPFHNTPRDTEPCTTRAVTIAISIKNSNMACHTFDYTSIQSLFCSIVAIVPFSPYCTHRSSPWLDGTGLGSWEAAEGGLRHAIDLVRLIREEHGDYFGVAVAGHPEGHVEGRASAAEALLPGDGEEVEGEGGEDAGESELRRLKDKVNDAKCSSTVGLDVLR